MPPLRPHASFDTPYASFATLRMPLRSVFLRSHQPVEGVLRTLSIGPGDHSRHGPGRILLSPTQTRPVSVTDIRDLLDLLESKHLVSGRAASGTVARGDWGRSTPTFAEDVTVGSGLGDHLCGVRCLDHPLQWNPRSPCLRCATVTLGYVTSELHGGGPDWGILLRPGHGIPGRPGRT